MYSKNIYIQELNKTFQKVFYLSLHILFCSFHMTPGESKFELLIRKAKSKCSQTQKAIGIVILPLKKATTRFVVNKHNNNIAFYCEPLPEFSNKNVL